MSLGEKARDVRGENRLLRRDLVALLNENKALQQREQMLIKQNKVTFSFFPFLPGYIGTSGIHSDMSCVP